MKRREFLARAGLAGVGLALSPSVPAGPGGTERPNLIFLLTDDQRWDMMGCAGNPWIRTPNMDALARDGCRFTHAFVTTSICAASRATFFTGLYERTHRYTFGTPPLAERFVDISYPVRLRAAGYRTGLFGKFGIRVPKGGAGKMFDVFEDLFRSPYFKKRPDGTERHVTDLLGDKAIGFLRSSQDGRPFCLSISFNAPHAEDRDPRQYIWPKAMDGLYADVHFPEPDDADAAFFARLPAFLRNSLNRERWRWRFDTPEKRQKMTRGYYRMISGVDAVIGRIRDELSELGLADNTVIVLMGDNGYFLGERGFAGKWLGYEPSLRVPLLVFDPRLQPALRGRVLSAMALNVDIAPTLLDLAGVSVPRPMQGRSLVPLLANRPTLWRSDFFCEHLFNHPKIPKYEGVRSLRWKYLRYFEQKPVYEELYDLTHDPKEEHNLAHDPQCAAELARLRQRCDWLRDRYGGPFVLRARAGAGRRRS
ncbi:MAG: sulfatase [Kiritimatiellaeota bacterium]|nr:sulfatase [Kiritimatiellota bacterium]